MSHLHIHITCANGQFNVIKSYLYYTSCSFYWSLYCSFYRIRFQKAKNNNIEIEMEQNKAAGKTQFQLKPNKIVKANKMAVRANDIIKVMKFILIELKS